MNAIEQAFSYLLNRHYPISPEDVKAIGSALKQVSGEYYPVRQEFWGAVYDAVFGFMDSKGHITTYKEPMATALAKAYINAGDIAYQDGGGALPMDEDTLAYAKSELSAQLSYVDSLFETLKQLRKEGDFDAISIAFDKANLWSSALDGFYNSIKMMAAGNKMLTWILGNTEKHCPDCLHLNRQRHRAKWFSSRGYTPRRPGSATKCGGYFCDCRLVDDDGNEFTI